MAEIYPTEGLEYINKLIANQQTPSDLYIRVYTNEVTLSLNNTLSDFTELVHPDYYPLTVGTDWVVTGDTLSLEGTEPGVSWELTSGGVSVVGVFITADDLVFYAGEFDAYVSGGEPITIGDAGAVLRFNYEHQITGA